MAVKSSSMGEKRVVKSVIKKKLPQKSDDSRRRQSDVSTSVGSMLDSRSPYCTPSVAGECPAPPQLFRQLPSKFAYEENANVFLRLGLELFGGSKEGGIATEPETEDVGRFACFLRNPEVDGSYPVHYFGNRLGAMYRAQKPAYILAICYLQRIVENQRDSHFPLIEQVFLRLMCGLLAVATKFSDDLYYTNSYYCEVLNLPVEVFNRMEREILFLLEYRLSERDRFRRVSDWFDSRLSSGGAPLSCVPTPISAELLLYTNKFGLDSAVALSLDTLKHSHIVEMDIQDTLVSRQYGNVTYQTQTEYLLNAKITSKSKHLNNLLKQAASLLS